ncbi:Helix-turn-helix domain protein [uncultured archaeon]|nr:Helix-turn-helix domain protein [uncultured archaeon]
MPQNEANPGEEKLLILPLGEESKKITQVISNDTARQIIELLADAPLSASDISERLSAPISTIVYNLENLESVGLIKVERIKYSEKGREVKIYAPVRKLIVVVPEKTDKKSVAELLKKYLGVLLAAVFASGLIEFLGRSTIVGSKLVQGTGESLSSGPSALPASTSIPVSVMNETARSIDEAVSAPAVTSMPVIMNKAVPAVAPSPVAPSATSDIFSSHPGIVFLLGCLFVIMILVILEYRRKRRNG